MRCIDADALIEDIREHSTSYFADDFAHEWVDKQPTIEPERKKGEWVGVQSYCKHLEEKTGERYAPFGVWNMIYCNQCWQASGIRSNFCPNCGADMRKEGDADVDVIT